MTGDAMSGEEWEVIVCLCGSTRFNDAFVAVNEHQTLLGKIVISLEGLGAGRYHDLGDAARKKLAVLRRKKLELADELIVIDCPGPDGKPYIDEITAADIAFAHDQGTVVRYVSKSYPRIGQHYAGAPWTSVEIAGAKGA